MLHVKSDSVNNKDIPIGKNILIFHDCENQAKDEDLVCILLDTETKTLQMFKDTLDLCQSNVDTDIFIDNIFSYSTLKKSKICEKL